MTEELRDIIRNDDAGRLQAFLVDTDINALNLDGSSMLQCCCISQSLHCVQHLLTAGADPDIQDCDGYTALHFACMDTSDDSAELVKLLVEHRANVEARLQPTTDSEMVRDWTPLMLAAAEGRSSSVETLTRSHVEVDAVDFAGMSALMLAASQLGGTEEKIRALLAAGASKVLRSHEGKSAYVYAMEYERIMTDGLSNPVFQGWLSQFRQRIIDHFRLPGNQPGWFERTYPELSKRDYTEAFRNALANWNQIVDILR